ncbi:hypothetical protein ACZ87_01037 [Candidatus Erwinia dacicola]|uniref:Uncharacterized protein n=1 Tax=Candidatus Erwinia dacicola TaxID=252393 RepID=A0A328TRT5_9GAMM|nr:hypothetical protein ACZ87_01037 [Candidatus Erwinia dacicola]
MHDQYQNDYPPIYWWHKQPPPFGCVSSGNGPVGLDDQLTPDWLINASLWHMDINIDSAAAGR